MSEKEKVEGYVEHIIFRNEENGYTVLNLSMKGRELTCVGTLPMIGEGELIEASGDYIEHAAYGKQFRIESYETKVPQDSVALERYLGSVAIKGVGAALAARIVRRFGDDTLRIIEEEPERLAEVKGISERKAREIAQQVAEKAEMQNAMIFLSGYGIALNLGAKIYQQYGDNVYRILKENPYKMAEDIAGVGFRTADEIAGKIGIAVDSEFRIKSGLSYVLNQATAEGHVYLPEPVLLRRGQKLLGVEPERMQKSLQDMAIDKKAVIRELPAEREGDEPLRIVYASQYYYLELSTARMLHELNITCEEDREAIEKRIGKIEKKYQIELDEMQKTAVVEAAYSGLMILTGGPGTGKTTVLKVILYIHQALCRSEVQLMAPTGRAARRMVESTGCENASTMHLALGLLGDDTDFEPDFEYLSAGFLNVDEVSMVDMHLAYEFFRRVSRHARVLLVGDKNQLPSVGAGDVFRQLIACGLIPVTVLDLVYRQGALSSIPYNAKLMQENKTNLSFGEDFQFIACKGADEAAEIVRRIYLDEIAKNGMDQVQILTPYRKRSAAGVDELNKSLEDFVNPPIAGKKELHIGSQVFRVGDKILQNKNTEMASNGDLGRILDCITDEDGNDRAVIGFPDGRQVQYEADQMEMIEHANATTIHKAQGSECPVVIIPWVKAFYMMLKRNILYTGVTRAKSKVYLVGEWAAVCQAIHTDDSGTRNTILSERIVQYYDQYQSEQKPEMEQLKLVV